MYSNAELPGHLSDIIRTLSGQYVLSATSVKRLLSGHLSDIIRTFIGHFAAWRAV